MTEPTIKQQEELLELLKFTPRTYTLSISGYGGESYAGRIDRKIYEHFAKYKIDLEDYATDWDEKYSSIVPLELQPFYPGSPYDCDGLFHASGAELSSLNVIRVTDEHGDDHWECSAGLNELEDEGVTVEEGGGFDLDDLAEDEVAYCGQQGEKGLFFEGEIELKAPFDPKKLKVVYENCDGWWLINYVEYDGESIDGSNGYSTTGKWGENKWVLGSGEAPYEPEELSEDDTEQATSAWPEVIEAPLPPMTDWFPADIKPVRKGLYEVTTEMEWPWANTAKADWTGRTWKINDVKVKITQWRGLSVDPATLSLPV